MNPCGLLLLTGGKGRRFGGPKHDQQHPAGGSWGSHLVDAFLGVFPGGPVVLLGEPLAERPGLPLVRDPGEGPAAALQVWAAGPPEPARRWWVVACDQVRWTAGTLRAWHAEAEAADPRAEHWVMARVLDHDQFLGGFLPGTLIPPVAARSFLSLRDLARELPCLVRPWPQDCWQDVDTPQARDQWLRDQAEG